VIVDCTMTDCAKVTSIGHVHFVILCTYPGFVFCESSNRGSTSDKFALLKVGKQTPITFYLSVVEARMLCRHRPTTLKYSHAILRSIQEIIKMHTLFYVNCVGYSAAFPLYLTLWELEVTPFSGEGYTAMGWWVDSEESPKEERSHLRRYLRYSFDV
jgi:hypothetical protein